MHQNIIKSIIERLIQILCINLFRKTSFLELDLPLGITFLPRKNLASDFNAENPGVYPPLDQK